MTRRTLAGICALVAVAGTDSDNVVITMTARLLSPAVFRPQALLPSTNCSRPGASNFLPVRL